MQNAAGHISTGSLGVISSATWWGVGSLDVEAMVGVWWVLIPLQKGPLKLNAQRGCGVEREKQDGLASQTTYVVDQQPQTFVQKFRC